MSTIFVPPIPNQTPVTNKDGMIDTTWQKWLYQLYLRTGGASAPDFGSLPTDVATLQSQMLVVQTNAAEVEVDLGEIDTHLTTLDGEIVVIEAEIAALGGGGTGTIAETTFTIVNNQAVAANVTGLLFDHTAVRSAEIDIQYYRNTTGGGATEMSARAKFIATYKTVAASWDLAMVTAGGDIDSGTGQPAGVTLTVTSAGQVQYISSNFSGTAASSIIHFKAVCMTV